MPCPGFTFGRFCSKKCTCVQKNSIYCNTEDGTCNCKPNFYGENCERDCDLVKSQLSESNLKCLERKVQTLSDDKTTLEQIFDDHKTAAQKKLEDHKSSMKQTLGVHKSEIEQKVGASVGKEEFERNLAGHKKAIDDHKSSLEKRLGEVLDEKAALEERVGDYKHHLTWNSWLTCSAFVLLFVVVGRMHLKNRKLKADLKVISVRYSRSQQSASVEETKVTFCNETNSPAQSNLFQSALGRVRRLTQHVPNSNNLPICETSLLGETNQANANLYETIEELKQKTNKATTRIQKS